MNSGTELDFCLLKPVCSLSELLLSAVYPASVCEFTVKLQEFPFLTDFAKRKEGYTFMAQGYLLVV